MNAQVSDSSVMSADPENKAPSITASETGVVHGVFHIKYYIDDAMKRSTNPSGILKKYLKTNYSDEVAIKLATYYIESGMIPKGENLYEKVIEKNPTAVGYVSDHAGLFV